MYGWDIVCGISKVTFEIPHKISNPYIKICFLYNIEILRALRFKSSYAFLKCPPHPTPTHPPPTTTTPPPPPHPHHPGHLEHKHPVDNEQAI